MKRILVGLDGSPRAALVLADAARLAELCGARLILFRAVVVPPELPRDALALADGHLDAFLAMKARDDLDRIAATAPRGLVEACATMIAVPWDGICRAAKEHDADMIVVGSHGYGGLDRVLGTTAAKVVNHADRNVLVVRTPL